MLIDLDIGETLRIKKITAKGKGYDYSQEFNLEYKKKIDDKYLFHFLEDDVKKTVVISRGDVFTPHVKGKTMAIIHFIISYNGLVALEITDYVDDIEIATIKVWKNADNSKTDRIHPNTM